MAREIETMPKWLAVCLGGMALLACAQDSARYDAVVMQQGPAALVGAGLGGELHAAVLCDANERLGDPDWPPIATWMLLPEKGETFEFAGPGFAKVDGRKVAIKLGVTVDGREFRLRNRKVRHDAQMARSEVAAACRAIGARPAINRAG